MKLINLQEIVRIKKLIQYNNVALTINAENIIIIFSDFKKKLLIHRSLNLFLNMVLIKNFKD